MVSEVGILSTAEHREYTLQVAKALVYYMEDLAAFKELFEEIGEEIPMPCINNYRDAWFHYKKMYEYKDYEHVIEERYALEEHLSRAVKDAVISYYHNYLFALQTLCSRINSGQLYNTEKEEEIKQILVQISCPSIKESDWNIRLRQELIGVRADNDLIKEATWWFYTHNMDLRLVLEGLREIIHLVKNYCLKLRIEGIDIYHPKNEMDYVSDCSKVYEKLIAVLEELNLKTGWKQIM